MVFVIFTIIMSKINNLCNTRVKNKFCVSPFTAHQLCDDNFTVLRQVRNHSFYC